MKHQTIFKRSALIFAVLMLCLVTVFTSIPVMAEDATGAATIYDLIYSDEKNEWERKPVKDYPDVATAFKEAKDGQLVVLHQDANLFLEPYNTVKVDKGNYQLNVTTDAGYKVRTVENRDGTVTVTTYKGQGEWFKSLDVAVGGGFGMRFFFESLGTVAENENAYLEVTVPQQDKTNYVRKLSKDDFKVDANGLYYFVANVAQAQLTDSIRFRIVVEDGNGKVIEYGRLRQYAFRDYADMLFAEADKTDAVAAVKEAVGDVKKMLNLGAQAQKLFNYNSGDLANDGIYGEAENGSDNPVNAQAIESTREVLANVGAAKKNEAKNDSVTITPQEFSLYLQSRNALQFRFVVDGLKDGDTPTAAISYGENATQKAKAVPGKLSTGGDCWVVSISNIPVSMYDTEFTVTLKYGGATATYSGSVLQWMYSALNSDKSTDEHKATATALYQYYLHVKGDEALVKPETEGCEHVNYEEVVKAATCTAAGSSRTVCSKCGVVIKDNNEITAPGHANKDYEAQAATCITTGWQAYSECSRCGIITSGGKEYTSKQDILIPTTEHNYSSEPSYSVQGKQVISTGVCLTCKKTSSYVVADYTDVVAVKSIDQIEIKEIGNTDTYDFKNQSLTAGNISVTYKTGAEGYTYYYKVDGGEYAEFNGSIGADVAGKTVTIAVADSRVEGRIVVATIYNVGVVTCQHEETSTKWVNGKGYAEVCDKCGEQVGDATPFVFTVSANNLYNATQHIASSDTYTDINVTANTDDDGSYVTYVPTAALGGNNTQDSERNVAYDASYLNGRTGKYFVMKYRADKAYPGNIQIYASTVVGSPIYTYNNKDADGNVLETKGSKEMSRAFSLNATGDWRILVVDLDKDIADLEINDGYETYTVDPFAANDKGEYDIKYIRIDYINGAAGFTTTNKLDIAYMGISNNVNEIKNIINADAVAACDHKIVDTDADGNALWYSTPGNAEHWNICLLCGDNVNSTEHKSTSVVSKGDGKNHVEYCADCGVEFNAECVDSELKYNNESRKYDGVCECEAVVTAGKSYFLVMNDNGEKQVSSAAIVTKELKDDDGTTYVRITESLTKDDDFFYMYYGGTEKTGQYIVIKYRVPTYYTDSTFGKAHIATTNSGNSGANGNGDQCSTIGTVQNDNEWHIAVIDLSKTNAANGNATPKFLPDDNDGCYYTSYVRMTLANLHSGETCSCTDTDNDGNIDHVVAYMDVDFVAFADNLGAIANYITDKEIKTGEDGTVTNPCQHDYKDQGGYVPTTGGHATSCATCGQATGEVVAHDAVTAPGVYNAETQKYETVCQCGYVTATSVNFVIEGQVLANNIQNVCTSHTNGHIASVNLDGDGNVVVDFEAGKNAVMYLFGDEVLENPAGRYFVMRYKVNSGSLRGDGTLYAAGGDSTHAVGADIVDISNAWVGNGEWQLAVFDLGLCPRVTADAVNGTFINFVRLDMGVAEGKTIQVVIDYAAMADDLDELKAYVGDADNAKHTHYYNGTYTYKDLSGHTSQCFYCGETMNFAHKSDNNRVWNTVTCSYTTDCTLCGGYATSQPFATTVNVNNSGRYQTLLSASDRFAVDDSNGTIKISGVLDTVDWASADKTSWQKTDENGVPVWKFRVLNTDANLDGTYVHKNNDGTVTNTSGDALTAELAAYPESNGKPAVEGYEYVSVIYRGDSEMYGTLVSSGTVTGRYMIVKYRASANYSVEIFTNTRRNTHSVLTYAGGTKNIQFSFNMTGDNDWHIYVVDLANKFQQDANKTYDDPFVAGDPIMYFRVDYVNDHKLLKGQYIEYAYIGLSDSLEEVAAAVAEMGDDVFCPHTVSSGDASVSTEFYSDDNTHWNVCLACGAKVSEESHTVDATKPFVDNGNGTHTATCETCGEGFIITCSNTGGMRYNGNTNKYDKICLCGGVVESSVSSFVVYLDASNIQQSGKKNTVFNVVPANGDDPAYLDVDTPTEWADASTADGKDQYWKAFSIAGNTSETGQYLIMKYRNPATSSVTAYMSTNTDEAYHAPVVCKTIPLVKGSQWNVLVYDMTANSNVTPDIDTDGDGVNDSYSVNFIRLGFGTSLSLDSDVIDIAYIGMVDCLDAAIDYVNENEIVKDAEGNFISNNCQHSIVGEEREFYSGVGYANICEICGDYVNVEPFKYTWMPNELMSSFGYSNMTEKVENGVWRLDYTGTTKITNVDAGCYLISNKNSTVKGQYFIVKIRSNQAVGGQVYTNTHTNSFDVTYTAADGTTGKIGTPHFNWSASAGDGWKVLIYDIDKLHADKYPASKYNNTDAFDVNETIKVMRFDLFDGTYDVGKWIEVAYVGISDSYDDIVSVLGSDAKYCVHNSSVVDTTKWVTSEDGTKCGNPCICGEIVNLTAHTGDEKLVEGTAYDETSHTETCTRCSAPIVVEHRSTYVFYESDDKYHPHCKVCDTALDGDAVYFLKQSSVVAGDNTVVTSMENGAYKRITQKTISSSESNVWLINSNTKVTGNYMIVKYRVPAGALDSSKYSGFYNNYSSTSNLNVGAGGAGTYIGSIGNFVADGQWKIMVYKFSDSVAFSAGKDGYSINYIRASIHFATTLLSGADTEETDDDVAPYFDIALVAFADTFDAFANYVQTEEVEKDTDGNITYNPCSCSKYVMKYVDGEGYVKFCRICGERDATATATTFLQYYDAAYIAGKVGASDVLTEDLAADGSSVRFTSTSATTGGTGRSQFFNSDKVTGRYLIIKYKSTVSRDCSLFINTYVNGLKDHGLSYSLENTQGEWTLLIKDLYTDNVYYMGEDGQYTAKHLTIDLVDREDSAMPVDSYIEYSYIAFAADLADLEKILAKTGDGQYCPHAYDTDSNVCKYCGYDKSPNMTVTTDKEEYAVGDTVTATLTLKNNPGFYAMPIALTYTDSEGTVTVVEEYTVESCATGFTEGDTMLVEKEDTTDYTADGELVTLTFAAPAEAGEYEIGWIVSEGEQIVNANEEEVAFEAKTATITVTE